MIDIQTNSYYLTPDLSIKKIEKNVKLFSQMNINQQ